MTEIEELDSEIHISGRYNVSLWHGAYYTNYVDSLKSWMQRRLAWLDEQFASPETMIASLGKNGEYDYEPDTSIGITAKETDGEIRLEIDAGDAEWAAIYINGTNAGTEALSDGKAILQADRALLKGDGTLNTIQVFKISKNGEKGTSNFTSFESPKDMEVPDPQPEVLTGTVTVSGTPVIGAVLKIDTADLNDTIASYQWLADGKVIADAVDPYYLVPEEMEGKQISAVITGETKPGNLTSESLEAVRKPVIPTDHLLIDQVFGGGGASGVPVSHSYIVIYNPTEEDIDLSEYRIGYLSNRSKSKSGSTGGEMVYLPLSGKILAGTSLLIRGAAEDTSGAEVILEIEKSDLEWESRTIDNKQYQVAIYQGDTRIDAISVNEEGLEGSPLVDPPGDEILSKNKAVCRNAHMDTDENQVDFNVINLSKAPQYILEAVMPKSQPEQPEQPDNQEQPDNSDQNDDPNGQDGLSVKTNRLNATSLKLQKGQKAKVLKLTETAVAGDTVVRWKSSKPKIVKVNAKTGKLTGKKTGKAVITAVLKSGATVSCNIKVTKKPVKTKAMTLAQSSITLKKGKKYKIKIKERQPLTANDKLTYKSADSKIAVVSAKGQITAKSKGKTVITVRSASGKKAELTVTVN